MAEQEVRLGVRKMSAESRQLRFLGRMFDPEGDVTTEFFIEPPGAPGPREQFRVRHLIARSSDGRPEFVTTVPDSFSEHELRQLIMGKVEHESSGEFSSEAATKRNEHQLALGAERPPPEIEQNAQSEFPDTLGPAGKAVTSF
jgi:hypothetical protein